MRLKLSAVFLFVLFSLSHVFGQNQTVSKHEFIFYKDDIKIPVADAEISIVVSGDTLKSNQTGSFYYFPIIDTAKNFGIIIKVNNIIFSGQGYKAWMLNSGTKIILGQLTKLNKLQSVAEYNGMTKKDEGWEWYSKRFYVIDRRYTIDINNRDKIKELQFLIISPNNSNSHVTTQKIIK